MSKGMIFIKKIITTVLPTPIAIYILFIFLSKEPEQAWFWATTIGIGNIYLLVFSPEHKISNGLKTLGILDWIVAAVLPFLFLLFIFFMPKDDLLVHFIKCICIFVMSVGSVLLGNKFNEWVRNKFKKFIKSGDKNDSDLILKK